MLTIQRFDLVPAKTEQKSTKPQKQFNNVVRLNANSPHLLENYLHLMGKNNLSLVSFGKDAKNVFAPVQNVALQKELVSLPDTNLKVEAFRPTLSDYGKWKIRTEATNRIYGKNPWKQLDNIEAWMVSAETNEFMIVGGLGKVAADLPASFNKKFAGDKNNNMSVVTPLYTYKDNYKVVQKNGKNYYQYGQKLNIKTGKTEPKEIELENIGSINVPIYNPQTNTKMQDTKVDVFKAYVGSTKDPETGKPNNDGTNYIFLSTPESITNPDGSVTNNAQIFNIQDSNPNGENDKTPYANNIHGTDEVTRMAFFSKAVYTLMRELKEGRTSGLNIPNSVILNDWHAGPLASMIHYTANAEADFGKISPETGRYFDEIPTLFIVHNCEHQGSTNGDDNKRTSIFATLFGEYGVDILSNAKSWRTDSPLYDPSHADKIALLKGNAFSCFANGLMLADRIVPVSEQYTEELLNSDTKANGMKDLFKARAFSPFTKTLTPITNGYSKSLIAPTEKHMAQVLYQAKRDLAVENAPKIETSDINFKEFADGNLENKLHNKNEIMKLIKRIQERELELSKTDNKELSSRKYFMHDPENTVIPDIEDFKDVPVVVFAGRVDPQKGVDTILKDALWQFAKENVDTPEEKLPLFIIGGKITQKGVYDNFKKFKDELRTAEDGKYKNIADRIVLFKGYVNTNLLATAGDMFLVPSVFEPCGLTQIEAMAKGSLPIATSTGGLVNTIVDDVDGFRTKAFFEQEGWETKGRLYGEGFNNNGEAYCEALTRAIDLFNNDRTKFEEMQKTAISRDFSWDKENGPLDKFISLIKTGKISA